MKRVALLTAFVLVSHGRRIGTARDAHARRRRTASSRPDSASRTRQFAEYFRLRGGVRILGFPISRSFTLEGFEVQFFQRVVLQLQGGQVNRLNVLDPGIMPMTRANQSQFPQN